MAASTPRKKRPKKAHSTPTRSSVGDNYGEPQYPLASFLWCVRAETSAWVTLPPILMVAFLFRVALGFWGYSGFQVPPMHGDYEAQRHWMELTINFPPSQWYFYDLQYWGLDYPPLTAYHSWIMGMIAWFVNPAWVQLHSSRGIEDPDLKLFMRLSVIVSEYLVYVPAAIFCIRRLARLSHLNVWDSWIILVAFLMQPATMLIDHGHFQYNTVMQGLVLGAVTNAYADRLLWCCAFFVGALTYKQMALYFAIPFFAHLLGSSVWSKQYLRLLAIGVVTLVAFAAIAAPLLLTAMYGHYRDPELASTLEPSPLLTQVTSHLLILSKKSSLLYALLLQATQILHRVFPFARGLFEDKVANFWCVLNVVYKLKKIPLPFLTRTAAILTLLGVLPSFVALFAVPQNRLLLPALASGAWAFFLFSFQVHEKSVLLPLLPTTLMLADDGSGDKDPGSGGLAPVTRAWVGWANALGAWTLYPLLKRDELALPYAVLTLLWQYLLGLPPASWELYRPHTPTLPSPVKLLHGSFYVVMLAWHVGEYYLPPPQSKPDLWVVLNCVVGAAGFGICYLWCTWQLYEKSGLLEGFKQKLLKIGQNQVTQESPNGKTNESKKDRRKKL